MGGTLRQNTSVAAGAVNTNIISGSKFEFLNRPAVVTVYGNFSENTPAVGDVEVTLSVGNVVAGEDLEPNIAGTAGVVKRNEDLMISAVGAPGDRVQIRVRNTDSAAAHTFHALIEIKDLM